MRLHVPTPGRAKLQVVNAWRRSPFFHFDVVVVSIVAVLIIGFSLASAGGDADAPSPGATGHATAVTIDPGANDPAVPQGFLGLSIEYPALEAYAGSDPSSLDPVFEQLVRNLAPGQAPVLRIGGNSADRAWWPMAGVSRPPGVTFDITPQWLRVTHALAQKLSARLILGVNLEQDSPQLASAEAQALVNGVGRQSVRALELGNEPDLYSAFPWYRADGHAVFGRPRSYDESEYISDFDGLSGALPRVPLAGPSLSGRQWTQGLGQFLAVESHLGLVTLHRYPLQVCLTPRTSARYPTIARLLSPATSTDLANIVRAVRRARPRSRPIAPRRRAQHGLLWRRPRSQQVVRFGAVGAEHAVRSSERGRLRRQRPHVPGGRLRAVPDRAYRRRVARGGLARVLRLVDVRTSGPGGVQAPARGRRGGG